jgi:hypothetical protein
MKLILMKSKKKSRPQWDGIGSKLSDKLQKLQNRAAHIMTRSSYDASSITLYLKNL